MLRRSRRAGTQLVRAGAGRWSAKAEKAFFGELARTGCVRWAAEAAGFSTNAIWYRRRKYPEFRARCEAAMAEARVSLHSFVVAAGLATFNPELRRDGLPNVTIAEAISILRLKGTGAPAAGEAAPEPSIEDVREEVLRRLRAMRRHRERGGG